MLKKEFVPYDESLELNAIGFNEPCICGYSRSTEQLETYSRFLVTKDSFTVDAPTFSQCFRWFRKKYEIAGEVNNYYSDGKWSYNYDIVTKYKEKASDEFDKHEDAELACLRKLIEIVKTNKMLYYVTTELDCVGFDKIDDARKFAKEKGLSVFRDSYGEKYFVDFDKPITFTF